MDSTLREFLSSGKALVSDTKKPVTKLPKIEKQGKHSIDPMGEPDPHRTFVKRVIKEKPPKKELVEVFQQFIDTAEEAL